MGGSAAMAGLSVSGTEFLSQVAASASPAKHPGDSNGVEHVVILTMKNRSFEHLLSWLPGADGRANLTYLSTDGNVYFPLARTSRAVATAIPTTAGRASSPSSTAVASTASSSGPPRRAAIRASRWPRPTPSRSVTTPTADTYHALADAGYLDNAVLVVTFDEWGGFFDHVRPPQVIDDTNPATVDHTDDVTTDGQAHNGPFVPTATRSEAPGAGMDAFGKSHKPIVSK